MKEQTCISCDFPTAQQICPECGDSQTEAYKREDERVMARARQTIAAFQTDCKVSDCCGAMETETCNPDTDRCPDCKELCSFVTEDDYFRGEAIEDEQEYESRQINSLIGTLVGLALLLSVAGYIAGVTTGEKVSRLLAAIWG